MKKKEFKIKISSGEILSYNSIECFFKENLKCEIFSSDINCFVSENDLFFCLNCKIKNYNSIEFILEELNFCFVDYSIKKEKGKDVLCLNGILRNTNPLKNKLFEKFVDFESAGFSFFIKETEFDEKFLKEKIFSTVHKIISFEVNNYESFLISYLDENDNLKTKEFNYEEIINFIN